MDRFDKFTERARVLTLAQEEAQRFNHNYIGTEHLLLGLVREGEAWRRRCPRNLGVELNKVRSAVEFIIGRGDRATTGEIGLTPRAKRVIELAVDEARRLNHSYIGTEHLLLGLVREGEGIAAGVLESLGVNLERVAGQTASGARPGAAAGAHAGTAGERARTPTLDQLGVDLTAAARRGSSTRSSAAQRDRAGRPDPVAPHEEQPGAHRRARRRQDLDRRGPGPPHHRRRRAGHAARQAHAHARHRLAGRRHEVPRRVRGAPEEGHRGDSLLEDCILFIDELHMLVGAGAAEGAVDAANILKPRCARGELQAIGATTLDEYRKHIERDAALERRFQPVRVDEPSVDETVEILKGVARRYEEHHKLTISDDALRAAAELSSRYVTDRFLPDKAIDLVDEAAARVRIRRYSTPPAVREATRASRRCGARRTRRSANHSTRTPRNCGSARCGCRPSSRSSRRKCRRSVARPADRERGGHPRRGLDVDRHPGLPRIASEESARLLEMEVAPPEPRHRPAEAIGGREGRAPRPRGPQGPEAAHRVVHVPRPDRRREDVPRRAAARVHVRVEGRTSFAST